MPYDEANPRRRDLLKGHLIACIIRVQEQCDSVRTECVRLEEASGHEDQAFRCHRTAYRLQRKADRYVKMYETLKKQEDNELR